MGKPVCVQIRTGRWESKIPSPYPFSPFGKGGLKGVSPSFPLTDDSISLLELLHYLSVRPDQKTSTLSTHASPGQHRAEGILTTLRRIMLSSIKFDDERG